MYDTFGNPPADSEHEWLLRRLISLPAKAGRRKHSFIVRMGCYFYITLGNSGLYCPFVNK